jgi:hypothetical protein
MSLRYTERTMVQTEIKYLKLKLLSVKCADPAGHAAKGVGFQLLDCCDLWFESHCKHGCSSLVFVVCAASVMG